MSYKDGKIRLCPNCHENILTCKCNPNQVNFVELTQKQFDQLQKQQKQEQNTQQ